MELRNFLIFGLLVTFGRGTVKYKYSETGFLKFQTHDFQNELFL